MTHARLYGLSKNLLEIIELGGDGATYGYGRCVPRPKYGGTTPCCAHSSEHRFRLPEHSSSNDGVRSAVANVSSGERQNVSLSHGNNLMTAPSIKSAGEMKKWGYAALAAVWLIACAGSTVLSPDAPVRRRCRSTSRPRERCEDRWHLVLAWFGVATFLPTTTCQQIGVPEDAVRCTSEMTKKECQQAWLDALFKKMDEASATAHRRDLETNHTLMVRYESAIQIAVTAHWLVQYISCSCPVATS